MQPYAYGTSTDRLSIAVHVPVSAAAGPGCRDEGESAGAGTMPPMGQIESLADGLADVRQLYVGNAPSTCGWSRTWHSEFLSRLS